MYDCPTQFTGKERDAESGLDYFGARYFSAAQGRFTTPDWSEKAEPIPYADLENPQSLNLYTYGRNNPLRWNDPDGHCNIDGETHNAVWCWFHNHGGWVQTQKEQAAAARASLAQAHGFTINGQTPTEIVKNGTDQQVIAADRTALEPARNIGWGVGGVRGVVASIIFCSTSDPAARAE